MRFDQPWKSPSLVEPGQIAHLWGLQLRGKSRKEPQPLLLRRHSPRTLRTIPCTPCWDFTPSADRRRTTRLRCSPGRAVSLLRALPAAWAARRTYLHLRLRAPRAARVTSPEQWCGAGPHARMELPHARMELPHARTAWARASHSPTRHQHLQWTGLPPRRSKEKRRPEQRVPQHRLSTSLRSSARRMMGDE